MVTCQTVDYIFIMKSYSQGTRKNKKKFKKITIVTLPYDKG